MKIKLIIYTGIYHYEDCCDYGMLKGYYTDFTHKCQFMCKIRRGF